MKKFLIVICLIILMIGIGIVCKYSFNTYNPYETKCVEAGCNNERVEGSIYCKDHKPSKEDAELDDCLHDMVPYVEDTTEENTKETTTYSYYNSSGSSSYSSSSSSYSGSSSSSPYKSYDEGYEAVYDDDDYDWDRYNSDSDYADGVDDALDELDD
jgi:hypothetical protein